MSKQTNKGFTIIEVLIVLSLAALIMLIVFGAVPALQRNQRNAKRKHDVSMLLGEIYTYTTHNKGNLPNSLDVFVNKVLPDVNFGYYSKGQNESGEYYVSYVIADDAIVLNKSNEDNLLVVAGAKCDGSNAIPSTDKEYVVLFSLEKVGSDPLNICQHG
jgi:prepilin-type N-terminal cleavage/methylation domain-containing protein